MRKMSSTEYYKKELLSQPVAQRIIQEIYNNKQLTRAELLKITGFSLATVYGKYVPRLLEYGVIVETKGPTGIRMLSVVEEKSIKKEAKPEGKKQDVTKTKVEKEVIDNGLD